MSYTIGDLIIDVLPRIARFEQTPKGIDIYQAANSVQSLIFKRLLNKSSDLLATGQLFLVIPAYDYQVPLPSDFLSMAEKPLAVDAPSWLISTAWMAGIVTSYDSGTKTLVLSVTSSNGSGTLASWSIAIGVLPGQPIYAVDTSVSSVAVGTGSKTFVLATGYALVPGQHLIISNVALPTDSSTISRLQPETLDNDDDEDYSWWDAENRYYGMIYETASTKPRRYKILGLNLQVRPKITGPILISGKYNAKPTAFTGATDIIPWNGFFDETFKEGSVRIVMGGISNPDADQAFLAFIYRDVDIVLNSRVRLIRNVGRIRRSNWL